MVAGPRSASGSTAGSRVRGRRQMPQAAGGSIFFRGGVSLFASLSAVANQQAREVLNRGARDARCCAPNLICDPLGRRRRV